MSINPAEEIFIRTGRKRVPLLLNYNYRINSIPGEFWCFCFEGLKFKDRTNLRNLYLDLRSWLWLFIHRDLIKHFAKIICSI